MFLLNSNTKLGYIMTNQINRSPEEVIKSIVDRDVLPHSMDEFQQARYEHTLSELCQAGNLNQEGTQRVIDYLRANVQRM